MINSSLKKLKFQLQIGDEVQWTDPDNEECSGSYRIREILTESGFIEDMDSVLVVMNDAGSSAEVFVREIL